MSQDNPPPTAASNIQATLGLNKFGSSISLIGLAFAVLGIMCYGAKPSLILFMLSVPISLVGSLLSLFKLNAAGIGYGLMGGGISAISIYLLLHHRF